MAEIGADHGSASTDLALLEIEVRRVEAQAKLAEARRAAAKALEETPKESWWRGSQVNVLLVGGIITLGGNIGVAAYNGNTSREQETIKAKNALDLEREKAKASLILQAISSSNPQTAQRNILFFVESGFILDPKGTLKAAASKYLPVLPSPGSTTQNSVSPADYGRTFWTIDLLQEQMQAIDAAVDRIVSGRDRLEAVGRAVETPWYIVGALWHLETEGRFTMHLHNGDPLTARTVNIPVGRPSTGHPPFSWEDSAIDAVRFYRLDRLNSQDIASILNAIERANGLGYRRRGISSPYLWAYTSGYTGGRFVADGQFDLTKQANYPGAVAILRRLHERGVIRLGKPTDGLEEGATR